MAGREEEAGRDDGKIEIFYLTVQHKRLWKSPNLPKPFVSECFLSLIGRMLGNEATYRLQTSSTIILLLSFRNVKK